MNSENGGMSGENFQNVLSGEHCGGYTVNCSWPIGLVKVNFKACVLQRAYTQSPAIVTSCDHLAQDKASLISITPP